MWKKVDVDESLLYGPVGGFMGLEELDADYDIEQEDGVTRVKVLGKKKGTRHSTSPHTC